MEGLPNLFEDTWRFPNPRVAFNNPTDQGPYAQNYLKRRISEIFSYIRCDVVSVCIKRLR